MPNQSTGKPECQSEGDCALDNAITPENRPVTRKAAIRGGEAHRWRKGQSGNPGGRSPMGALARACRTKLGKRIPYDDAGRRYAEAIADYLGGQALLGDLRSIRELADRAEGRPGQLLEMEVRPPEIDQWECQARCGFRIGGRGLHY